MGLSFAVRRKILEELFADSAWSARMEKAKTQREVVEVLMKFCRAKGYKVGFTDEF